MGHAHAGPSAWTNRYEGPLLPWSEQWAIRWDFVHWPFGLRIQRRTLPKVRPVPSMTAEEREMLHTRLEGLGYDVEQSYADAVPKEEIALAERLEQYGYAVNHNGVWYPTDQGFQIIQNVPAREVQVIELCGLQIVRLKGENTWRRWKAL